jgi:ABC-type multidrug transport system ATPase subunit
MQLVNLLAFLVERRPPGLVLLDEPLNGLDYNNRQRVKELLRLLRSNGASIVLVSHDTDDLGADKVVDLDTLQPRTIASGV